MRKLVIGMLAHVDAGKTTLSEGLLYAGGAIRKLGRVDNKDAFLDTFALERARGITIFSKQAKMTVEDAEITLLDTPGHVDFSPEMERTLQVLDLAVLVINGADGVQAHTRTLWRLLSKYEIPAFIFINKMDQPGNDAKELFEDLTVTLGGGFVRFDQGTTDNFYDSLAMCEEHMMEDYLEHGSVQRERIKKSITDRKVFPCYFGSALRMNGVEDMLQDILDYASEPAYSDEFGARVFKIARDEQGNRLTYLKLTGGKLFVRGSVSAYAKENAKASWEEKVNQIRLYSGAKYDVVGEVEAGDICAVTGLTQTYPGEGLGKDVGAEQPVLEPVLTYQIILPPECDARAFLPKLRQLEEEEPQLHIVWDEKAEEIQAKLMGEVQLEILTSLIKERFGIVVDFGPGSIVYKETIANVVEGVGHFEPLRHYAEVHLLMEPGEPGSGIQVACKVSEDELDKNWQRLILTHIEEREHKGVLTGSVITDTKITLVAGRAHLKHTEGGDFRQATYRAVRQGLMQAQKVLLEPFYEFRMELPQDVLGRALHDLNLRHGQFESPVIEGDIAVLTGSAPVATMRDYQLEFVSYTRGQGHYVCELKGYYPCHNTDKVLADYSYDPELDWDNPTGSVFCAHGVGYVVEWSQVPAFMHVDSGLGLLQKSYEEQQEKEQMIRSHFQEVVIGEDEIEAILSGTYRNSGKKERVSQGASIVYGAPRKEKEYVYKGTEQKEEYLLVDGYNVIFAWKELSELAKVNIDSARGKLLDIMSNYQGYKKCNLIVVFDAYRIEGHAEETVDYHNIHVVYTKEAETADRYIERFAHAMGRKYDVTVATSDGLEQVIIRGQGCKLLSSRDLEDEVTYLTRMMRQEHMSQKESAKNYLFDHMDPELAKQLDEVRLGKKGIEEIE